MDAEPGRVVRVGGIEIDLRSNSKMETSKALIKLESDDFAVEFETLPVEDETDFNDLKTHSIIQGLDTVEKELKILEEKVDKLNYDIDKLANHADGLDYTLAVASGILTGIYDYFTVGEFSLKGANEFGQKEVEEKILKAAADKARKNGDNLGRVDTLDKAVSYLEDKYKIAADTVLNPFGGGRQHHLRDFSHHFSPTGLFFSLLTQFTGKVYGTDVTGRFIVAPLDEKGMLLIGKTFKEKITFGVINWYFHMLSDIAGSSGTIKDGGTGTGLPGPIMSLLKKFATLPSIKLLNFNQPNKDGNKELSVWVSKLFNGTLFAERDAEGKIIKDTVVPFDYRTELGIKHHAKKQAVPVIMNECVVRAFYFIRRLYTELRDNNIKSYTDLKNINWKKTFPYNNRTITRMLTIATGTFTAINFTGAAINAARKPGGLSNFATFGSYFILRVNFVGVGRFAVACYTDIKMGIQRSRLADEKLQVYSQMLFLHNAKVFYRQADMWVAAENASTAVEKSYQLINDTTLFFNTAWNNIIEDMEAIGRSLKKLDDFETKKRMIDILRY